LLLMSRTAADYRKARYPARELRRGAAVRGVVITPISPGAAAWALAAALLGAHDALPTESVRAASLVRNWRDDDQRIDLLPLRACPPARGSAR